jgi:hypothetical protein
LAANEVLGLVLGWIAGAPADVLAAKDVHHCCAIAGVGNMVNGQFEAPSPQALGNEHIAACLVSY